MDTNTLLMIGFGIAVILFFVTVFFAARTFRVFHLMMMVLVCVAGVFFFIMSVFTLKTHQEWRAAYNILTIDIAEKEATVAALEAVGTAEDPDGVLAAVEDSIPALEQELIREMWDRGRVWRGVVPSNFDGQSVKVDIYPLDAAAPAGDDEVKSDERPPHQIAEGNVLHVFRESDDVDTGMKLPTAFLGTFTVTTVTPTSVVLTPGYLTGQQLTLIRDTGATWALYDKMPVDTHEAFAGFSKEELIKLMPNTKVRLPQVAYEALIKEYLFDQKTPDKDLDTIPPDRVWKLVEFTETFPPEDEPGIRVDAVDGPAEFSLRYFNEQGEALPASIRISKYKLKGLATPKDEDGQPIGPPPGDDTEEGSDRDQGTVRFRVGDMAWISSGPFVDQLVDGKFATVEERRYERQLRDYASTFDHFKGLIAKAVREQAELQFEFNTLRVPNESTVARVNEVTVERDDLAEDLRRFEEERDLMGGLVKALQNQTTVLASELGRLWRENLQMAEQLSTIERRTQTGLRIRAIEAEAAADAAVDRALGSP